jgi:hypothetical protein
MFLNGFEKIAYDSREHLRDLEATDLKHVAKRNPYTWGLGMTGAGAALGGLLNRMDKGEDARSLVEAAKKVRNPPKDAKKAITALKKHPEEYIRAVKSKGLKSGAIAGGAIGAALALMHAKRVSQARKLEEMPPEYKDVYLRGAFGH